MRGKSGIRIGKKVGYGNRVREDGWAVYVGSSRREHRIHRVEKETWPWTPGRLEPRKRLVSCMVRKPTENWQGSDHLACAQRSPLTLK
jgi:hypothetical protein